MRLILGSGSKFPKEKGDVCLDIRKFPNVDVVHDLNRFPWPFDDSSVNSIIANHVVEHLQCLLVPFMDECWRILKPGASLYLQTPLAGVNPDLEWADPTHVRCYRIHSFVNYLSPEGIAAFGYTDKPWNFFVLRVSGDNKDVVEVHALPMKRV